MRKFLNINILAVLIGFGIALTVMTYTTRDVTHFFIISAPYFILLLYWPLGLRINKLTKILIINLLLTLSLAILAIGYDTNTGLFQHASILPILWVSILQFVFAILYILTHLKNKEPLRIEEQEELEITSNKNYFFCLLYFVTILHGVFLILLLTSSNEEDVNAATYWFIGTVLTSVAMFYIRKNINFTYYILATIIVIHTFLAYLSILAGINTTGVYVIYGITVFAFIFLLLLYHGRVQSMVKHA